MRFHVLAGALAGAACLLFGVSRTEALMVVLAVAGVLIAEVANTVAESLTNLMEPQLSAIAKVTKDVGAAGVLLAAGFSVLVAGLVFYPVLWDLPQRLAGFVDRRLPYFGVYLAVVVIPSAIGPLLPERCDRRGRR